MASEDYCRIDGELTVNRDALGATAKGRFWSRLTDTAAIDPEPRAVKSILLHANVFIVPRRNLVDVSEGYLRLRKMRMWKGTLTGSSPIASNYLPQTGWEWDPPPGGESSWADIPGMQPEPDAPAQRQLQEFLIAVASPTHVDRPLPEFGALYYLCAVDYKPPKYKVWIARARHLTGEQTLGFFGGTPHAFPTATIPVNGPPDFSEWRYASTEWLDVPKRN
jgi:hypothetical protein